MTSNTPTEPKLLIEAKDLSFGHTTEQHLIRHLDLNLSIGETLGVIGPNGGGKTTLLKLIAGLIKGGPEYEGSLKVFDYERKNMALESGHLPPISYLPQQDEMSSYLPITVKEVLSLPKMLKYSLRKSGQAGQVTVLPEKELIEQFELSSLLNQDFRNLSGGQRQKVLLAKTFLLPSPLVLLDEPTKGLDSQGQDQFLGLLKRTQTLKDRGILIIDHHIQQVLKHCDKVLCLGQKHHWHEETEGLDPHKILNSIYECEFEHQLIHETPKESVVESNSDESQGNHNE